MINGRPLISIVIPVYNNAEHLVQCFNSICNQTDKEFELVVVDDGSTDGSEKICDDYFVGEQNTIVIHQKNGGSVCSRKTGIRSSSGEYIAFCDADDWVELGFVEEIKKILNTGADFIQYGIINERQGKNDISKALADPGLHYIKDRKSLICDYYLLGMIMPMICKVVKRELCDVFLQQPDNQQFGEDNIFTIGLLANASSFYISEKNLYHYRIYDGSLSHKKGSELSNSFIEQGKVERELLYREGLLDSEVSKAQFVYFFKNLCYMMSELPQKTIPNISILYGKKIVLYGAGRIGKQIYEIIKNDRRIDIVGWTDSNFQEISGTDYEIIPPDAIRTIEFDIIIICVKKRELASEIICNIKKMGISEEKILWENPDMTVNVYLREIGVI